MICFQGDAVLFADFAFASESFRSQPAPRSFSENLRQYEILRSGFKFKIFHSSATDWQPTFIRISLLFYLKLNYPVHTYVKRSQTFRKQQRLRQILLQIILRFIAFHLLEIICKCLLPFYSSLTQP